MRNILILLAGMALVAADPTGPKPLTELQELKLQNTNLRFQTAGCQAILNEQQVVVNDICKGIGADTTNCRIDNSHEPWTVAKTTPTPAPPVKPLEKK